MGERRGTKALELWCRRITEGYPGVNVQNMTTSWKDGLAFCAMIHHFRPDLIDFDGLDKNNVYGNNELAFRIAEQHLGIPALLDAEDMASCSVPDRLSILTYLSQFYQTFGGSSPTRHPVTRTAETIEERIAQVPESPKEKEMSYPAVRKDLCAVCRLPIFLAEKLVLARVAYHRTCFRCARCNNQLTLGNYYETEEGQYCCETCPDEEIPPSTIQNWDDSLTLSRTEKDEVDTSCKTSTSNDDSVNEGMFTYNAIKKLNHEDSPIPDLIAQTSRLRLNFISNQLLSEQSDNSQTNENLSSSEEDGTNLEAESIKSVQSVNDEYEKQKKEDKERNCLVASLQLESHGSKGTVEEVSGNFINTKDHFHDQSNTDKHMRRQELASPDIVKDKSVFRNDIKKVVEQIEQSTRAESSLSLVQQRRRIFEKEKDYIETNKNDSKNKGILKLKVQREEPRVAENIENSVKNTNTVKEIIDQEDIFRRDSENSNATSLQMTSCEESLLDTWKVSKNSSVALSYKESSEDQVCTDAVNDVTVTNISANLNKEYPEDLNPFKSDEEEEIADKFEYLNPFGNEDEEEEEEDVIEKRGITPPKPAVRNNFSSNKTNEKLLMEGPTKRRLAAPQINLNPFWSDEDDHDSDIEPKEKTSEVTPVPKPRTLKYIQEINTQGPKSDQSYESLQTSNSPLRSPESGISIGGTYKKKKPAPLPPNMKDSPAHSTPKTRKTKPAPPPPIPTTSNFEQTPVSKTDDVNPEHNVWEDQKINKDEANRNRQSFTHVSCEENFHYRAYLDKSVEGKWKRKKGPAPPCPIPHRRKIKVMSLKDVKVELDEIELQQQGLEKQGVRLEQLIRNKCESGSRANDVSLGTDVEELVLELFALVNEKNELFRRQAELMLLRRQQRLEEEHAEIEYQIRCLMSQHESTKTDFDKQREEALIQRLVEIVEKRNEIVDCLEMDRRREIEEDRSIHKHMDLFAAKNKNESSSNEMDTVEKKKRKQNKQKEKAKEKKLKKAFKKDIDKDVDEIELTLKRHTKRKWF